LEKRETFRDTRNIIGEDSLSIQSSSKIFSFLQVEIALSFGLFG